MESALAIFLARRRSVHVGSDVSLPAGSFSLVGSLSTGAAFFDASPIKKGFNSTERVVMGDKYRYRDDTNKLRNVQFVDVFLVD